MCIRAVDRGPTEDAAVCVRGPVVRHRGMQPRVRQREPAALRLHVQREWPRAGLGVVDEFGRGPAGVQTHLPLEAVAGVGVGSVAHEELHGAGGDQRRGACEEEAAETECPEETGGAAGAPGRRAAGCGL